MEGVSWPCFFFIIIIGNRFLAILGVTALQLAPPTDPLRGPQTPRLHQPTVAVIKNRRMVTANTLKPGGTGSWCKFPPTRRGTKLSLTAAIHALSQGGASTRSSLTVLQHLQTPNSPPQALRSVIRSHIKENGFDLSVKGREKTHRCITR